MRNLDTLIWHDGQLIDLRITPGKPANKRASADIVTLEALLRPNLNTRERQTYRFTFRAAGMLSFTCDLDELRDHRGPGNISYAHFKTRDKERFFVMYLADGHLALRYSSVKVETNAPQPKRARR